MGRSEKIDKWVTKNPESWAKLVETKQKTMTFEQFKKKFKINANQKGKTQAIKQMTNQQIMTIYQASGLSQQKKQKTITTTSGSEPAYATKKITVKTKKTTYTRTIQPRWKQTDLFALNFVAKLKPRTKEYNKYVQNIIESTGRTRQAVVKKIQRTRKTVKQ